MNPDGSDVTLVLESGSDPAWSPDGSKIAYVSFDLSEPCTPDAYAPSSWYYIWIMNSDGTDRRQISNQRGCNPAWSSDGTKIVYEGSSPDLVYDTGLNIVNLEGSDDHQILNFGRRPDWSHPWVRI